MQAIVVGDIPLVLVTVLWLVFLEGLLSADNALVLAVMVRHLPKHQQRRALRYGMWGAFAFRFVAVLLSWWLLKFWFLKVAGGIYLLYLSAAHFISGEGGDDAARARRYGRGFWGTVVSVELADIAFSIDSILAAVAMADGLTDRIGRYWTFGIVVLGGILGIITMRFVAGYFIILLERFRGLEPGAYGLVAWIGLKLVIGGLHSGGIVPLEMHEWLFWLGMLGIVLGGFLYKPYGNKKKGPEPDALVGEVVELMGGQTHDKESKGVIESDQRANQTI
jgi:YkoY family integral membrane protein